MEKEEERRKEKGKEGKRREQKGREEKRRQEKRTVLQASMEGTSCRTSANSCVFRVPNARNKRCLSAAT